MRKNSFRTLDNNSKKYFHLNIDFQATGLFKQLDWIFVQKKIEQLRIEFKIEVHALVMMDTHLHLLIATKNQNENFFAERLKADFKAYHSTENYCEPILAYSQYLNTYKYIYRNPVESHLVKFCENYLYSSLNCLLGRSVAYCQVVDQLRLIQNPIHILNWLNSDNNFKISQLKLLRQDNSLLI